MFAKIKLYLMGGAALAVLALVSSLLWQLWDQSIALSASEASRIQAQSQLDQAVAVNRVNAVTLQTLARFKELDNQQLTKLAAELQQIQTNLAEAQVIRTELAEKDPDVKTFLNTPIPGSLRGGVSAPGQN